MKNWIEIAALHESLGNVDQRYVARAMAMASPEIAAARALIDHDAQADRYGLSVDPTTEAEVTIQPVTQSMAVPLILCLIVQEADLNRIAAMPRPPKNEQGQEVAKCWFRAAFANEKRADALERFDKVRQMAPLIAIVHTEPARANPTALRQLEACLRGFPEQRIKWFDISDPDKGWRHGSWPAENGDGQRATLTASAVRPLQPSPLPVQGGDLLVSLDASWCWEGKAQPRAAQRARRTYSDPDSGPRAELERLLRDWLKRGTITVAPPGRDQTPDLLQKDLKGLLEPGKHPDIGWQSAEYGHPLADLVTALTPEEVADISHAQVTVEGQSKDAGSGDPEAAVRAYEALVNGQINSIERVTPPDLAAIGQTIKRQAEAAMTRCAQILTGHASREMKHRDAARAILSRLAETEKGLIRTEIPTIKSGRNKRSDYTHVLEIAPEARAMIAARVIDVVHGVALNEVEALRLYWLRFLRPRYVDQIQSQSGLGGATPTLPSIEGADQTFRPFVADRQTVRDEIEREIAWPKAQRIPALLNIKAIRGEFRKISRIAGLLLGLTALVGLSASGVSDGFYISAVEKVVADKIVHDYKTNGKLKCTIIASDEKPTDWNKVNEYQKCMGDIHNAMIVAGQYRVSDLTTGQKLVEIAGYTLTLLASPFVVAVLIIFVMAFALLSFILFVTSRNDLITDKRMALEDGLERAVSAKLQDLLAAWHKHFETENKIFMARFEAQVDALLKAPQDVATAAHDITTRQLRKDAERAEALITAQQKRREEDGKRLQAARKLLKDKLKRALGTIGWKDM